MDRGRIGIIIIVCDDSGAIWQYFTAVVDVVQSDSIT